MTYYLGAAGAFTAIPDPEVGLSQTPERIGGTHQLLSGAKVRDTLGRMRTWNLSWTAIDLATFGTLQSFYYGIAGAGPYYFLDPEQRNLLPSNVSSGTDTTKDTTGFSADTATGMASSTGAAGNWPPDGPFPKNGTQTLIAGVPNGGGGGGVNMWHLTNEIPVAAGLAYTFSAYMTCDTGITAEILVNWFNGSHTYISTTTGNAVSSGRSVASTASAPSGATTAQLLAQTPAVNSSGVTKFFYTDGLQFEQASSVSAWAPGIGVPLVTVDALSRSTPIAGVCDAQMTLVQVG